MSRQSSENIHFIEQFTPEFRLILACLRGDGLAADDLHTGEFTEEQWNNFLLLARRHRVELLLARFARESQEIFPLPVLEKIRGRELKIRQKILRLKASLFRIMNLLHSAGIRALALKGPALAMQFYPDPDTRQARDLDILIDPEKIQEAVQLLLQQGYAFGSKAEERWFNGRYASFHRVFPHLGMTDSKTGIRLELHWRLFTFPEFELGTFDELWNRKAVLQQDAQSIQTLSAGDHFRYICLHGLFHGWYQLSWINDVAMTLQHQEDWEEIFTSSSKPEIRPVLQQAQLMAGMFSPPDQPVTPAAGLSDAEFIRQANAFSLRCLAAGGQSELTGIGMRIRRALFFRKMHRLVGISLWNYALYLIRKGWLRLSGLKKEETHGNASVPISMLIYVLQHSLFNCFSHGFPLKVRFFD
jgi:hypothetical protein